MHRFFVPAEYLHTDTVALSGPITHQMTRVLHLRAGEHILLLDNTGTAYEVRLDHVSPKQVVGCIVEISQPQTEPQVHMTLLQALPKERKLDWVLQKGTELGVSNFVPLLTARTLSGSRERPDAVKLDRWRRIVMEAAEQSGRVLIPEISPALTLAEACKPHPKALSLIAAVGTGSEPLRTTLDGLRNQRPQTIRLFVGPEGGFTAQEVDQARAAGALPISLGPRVLRTETAGLVAVSAILYALGELD